MSSSDNNLPGGLLGGIRKKLVDAKQKWSKEGRLLSEDASAGKEPAPDISKPGQPRLPPGQRLVPNWPVLDLGVQPEIPLDKWRLQVDGNVENPLRWTWEDFKGQPVFKDTSDMHCVTSWSRYDNRWEGVSAKHLISMVKPAADVRHVVFHSFDTYTTNVPLADFADDDVLLATKWEGEPIAKEHGGPVRIILPKLYLWKSAKWVKRIEFVSQDRPGFWEVRGYHNYGDPWREQRYDWQD